MLVLVKAMDVLRVLNPYFESAYQLSDQSMSQETHYHALWSFLPNILTVKEHEW